MCPCIVCLVIQCKLGYTNLGYIEDHCFLWCICYSYSKGNGFLLSSRKGFDYKCSIKLVIKSSGACDHTVLLFTGSILRMFWDHILYKDILHVIVNIDGIIDGISVLNHGTCCRICGFVNFKTISQFNRTWCFGFHS